jgi:uracil-DNA glycosylase
MIDGETMPADWGAALGGVDCLRLNAFLAEQRAQGRVVYPPQGQRLTALALTRLDDVRVVILGQDPYHGPGQAHGLAFSVQRDTRVPPSLVNIYKELQSDLGLPPPSHGDLSAWAGGGVLLLNTVLTVEQGQPGSHQSQGWEAFTDACIAAVAARAQPCVFLLWGAHAQKKAAQVAGPHHLVLYAPHPSPLSAYRGWFGSRPFSAANAFLESQGAVPIDWRLT